MNKKTLVQIVAPALLLALGLFSGCESKPEIGYEADRTENYAALKTFYLVPFSKTAGVQGETVPGQALKYAGPVNDSIKNNMIAKGYTEAPADKADMLIAVRSNIVPKVDVTDWGYGYAGYGRWGGGYWGGAYGSNVTVDQYNEGTARIEVYSRAKKDLIWVGYAKNRISDKLDVATVGSVVTQILNNFPPPPPGMDNNKKK
jgi:hypothetical protein